MTQNKAKLSKILIIALVFDKKRQFFYNIDPEFCAFVFLHTYKAMLIFNIIKFKRLLFGSVT
jgi:hypothetical protein